MDARASAASRSTSHRQQGRRAPPRVRLDGSRARRRRPPLQGLARRRSRCRRRSPQSSTRRRLISQVGRLMGCACRSRPSSAEAGAGAVSWPWPSEPASSTGTQPLTSHGGVRRLAPVHAGPLRRLRALRLRRARARPGSLATAGAAGAAAAAASAAVPAGGRGPGHAAACGDSGRFEGLSGLIGAGGRW